MVTLTRTQDTNTPLRRLIRTQGRTITWLAGRAGVERSGLSRMVSGHRPMPPSVAQRVADLLGVPVDTILPG